MHLNEILKISTKHHIWALVLNIFDVAWVMPQRVVELLFGDLFLLLTCHTRLVLHQVLVWRRSKWFASHQGFNRKILLTSGAIVTYLLVETMTLMTGPKVLPSFGGASVNPKIFLFRHLVVLGTTSMMLWRKGLCRHWCLVRREI